MGDLTVEGFGGGWGESPVSLESGDGLTEIVNVGQDSCIFDSIVKLFTKLAVIPFDPIDCLLLAG